jgi:hypothetical protein
VKSVVLMVDLDHPDSLIVPLFTSCFDIVSGSSKAHLGKRSQDVDMLGIVGVGWVG